MLRLLVLRRRLRELHLLVWVRRVLLVLRLLVLVRRLRELHLLVWVRLVRLD